MNRDQILWHIITAYFFKIRNLPGVQLIHVCDVVDRVLDQDSRDNIYSNPRVALKTQERVTMAKPLLKFLT